MIRHLVNFGLLASFLTLAVTGILAFVRPFSLVTTRLHLVFGLATMVLVGLHLLGRLTYFKRQLARTSSQRAPRPLLLGLGLSWAGLVVAAWVDWSPVRAFVSQSYEARQRAHIVRASPLTGFLDAPPQRFIARQPADAKGKHAAVSLWLRFASAEDRPPPAVAVWAETGAGAMIETLYVDPTLAYSDAPVWGGKETPRHHILPLWRNRYTLVSGVDPNGDLDGLSGATSSHSFSLDDYLALGEESSFVLCVEVNAPQDPNEAYPDPHLGQPSLLYTALLELDSEQTYALLELTGHGGGAERNGMIQYDLDGVTTSKQLIDLLLAKSSPSP